MKVLVPVKRVIDYKVKVRIKADGRGVDLAMRICWLLCPWWLPLGLGHNIALDAPNSLGSNCKCTVWFTPPWP
jgi:hypothetical protein